MGIFEPQFTRTWIKEGFTIQVLADLFYSKDYFHDQDIRDALLLAAAAGMRRFVASCPTTRGIVFPRLAVEVQVSVEAGKEWEEAAAAARSELVRIARCPTRKISPWLRNTTPPTRRRRSQHDHRCEEETLLSTANPQEEIETDRIVTRRFRQKDPWFVTALKWLVLAAVFLVFLILAGPFFFIKGVLWGEERNGRQGKQ